MCIDRVKLITEMARKRMTVKKMSEITGLSLSTMANVRAGKPCTKSVIFSIARALGIDPADLIAEEV